MTHLAMSRQHTQRTALSGFLAVLFLAQALLLPWLTAPQMVQTAGGQWAMMCTLQGLQRVSVESGKPVPASKTNHCPACTLAHFVDVPLPTINMSVVLSQWQYSGNVINKDKVATFWSGHSDQAIRAPPVV